MSAGEVSGRQEWAVPANGPKGYAESEGLGLGESPHMPVRHEAIPPVFLR